LKKYEKDDENGVISAINKLNKDRELLNNLKANAKKTAETWRNWEEASKEYSDVIKRLNNNNNSKISEQLVVISKIWEKYEENKTKSDLLNSSRMLKLYLKLKRVIIK
jgi:predicted MarR family transcription regulator